MTGLLSANELSAAKFVLASAMQRSLDRKLRDNSVKVVGALIEYNLMHRAYQVLVTYLKGGVYCSCSRFVPKRDIEMHGILAFERAQQDIEDTITCIYNGKCRSCGCSSPTATCLACKAGEVVFANA